MILGRRKTIISVENRSSSYLWLAMYQFCKRLVASASFEHVCMARTEISGHVGIRPPEFWKHSGQVWRPTQPYKLWVPSLDEFDNPVFTTASEAAYPRALCQAKAVVLECARRGVVFWGWSFSANQSCRDPKFAFQKGSQSLATPGCWISEDHRCPANCDFKTLDRIPFKVKKGEVMTTGSLSHGKSVSGMSLETPAGRSSMLLIPKLASSMRSRGHLVSLCTCKHPWTMHFLCQTSCCKQWLGLVSDGPKLTDLQRRLNIKKVAKRVCELRRVALFAAGVEGALRTDWLCGRLHLWRGEGGLQTVWPGQSFRSLSTRASTCATIDRWAAEASSLVREAAIGKCKPFDGGKLDKVTWEKILQERDKGWISGPFSA